MDLVEYTCHEANACLQYEPFALPIPKLVLGSDASKLAHMLEHDVLNWGLDMNELHRLSGGHAIVALQCVHRTNARALLFCAATRWTRRSIAMGP